MELFKGTPDDPEGLLSAGSVAFPAAQCGESESALRRYLSCSRCP